jgi:hypothetical protein
VRTIPAGFGFPLGCATAVVVEFGAVAGGAATHPVASLVALAGATAVLATLTTLPAALGTAAVAWALHSGFILGRHGDLALTHASAGAAITLAATALLVSTVARFISVHHSVLH